MGIAHFWVLGWGLLALSTTELSGGSTYKYMAAMTAMELPHDVHVGPRFKKIHMIVCTMTYANQPVI